MDTWGFVLFYRGESNLSKGATAKLTKINSSEMKILIKVAKNLKK